MPFVNCNYSIVLLTVFFILEEMGVSRDGAVPIDCGTNLADILSSALPPTPHDKSKEKSSDSSVRNSICPHVCFYITYIYFLCRMVAAKYLNQHQHPV